MGGMNGGVGYVTEKGFALVPFDKIDRGIRYGIGDQGLIFGT